MSGYSKGERLWDQKHPPSTMYMCDDGLRTIPLDVLAEEEILMEMPEMKDISGLLGPDGQTTDGQQEATRRPSLVNSVNGDRRTKGPAWRFSIDEVGKMRTYCSYCGVECNTANELYSHVC